ncbi:manganese efflux pump MntP family protein [uncultured Megasphaera sp.]|uniref:manganese efflux pump MntP n=1 Tax=uncultured Megasphaera sp. TaxID=165188 RepID=UPI002659F2DE|nr:manganese efflux pump MntP family protein [uncultured Megasphaera sp.]
MSTFELLLLAIGLSMDAFAVSICKGLSLGRIQWKHMVIAGAWFGGFQFLMPTLGYYLGNFFTEFIMSYNYWVAFVLLTLIGANMIRESFDEEEDCPDANMAIAAMFALAIATSIDALAVGVTFAFMDVSIIPAAISIGCVTFACSAAGVKAGSLFGLKYKAKAERIGGFVLILIGLKILLEGLGWL